MRGNGGRSGPFEKRWNTRKEAVMHLYFQLYHGDTNNFRQLVGLLEQKWRHRPPAMKKLDLARGERPDWFEEGRPVFSSIFSIEDGRPADTTLSCSQTVLRSPPGDVGTAEDLTVWRELAEAQGALLCAGLDLSATEEGHPWAAAAAAAELEYCHRYFFFSDWASAERFSLCAHRREGECEDIFTWLEGSDRVVMTTSGPRRWDLNYANPVLFYDVVFSILELANGGADLIYLKNLPLLWKEPQSGYRDLPQSHSIVRLLRLMCETVCPGVLLVGDGGEGYFGSPDAPECHLIRDERTAACLWNALATRDGELLRRRVDELGLQRWQSRYVHFARDEEPVRWALDYDALARQGLQPRPHRRYLNRWYVGRLPGSPARGELFGPDEAEGAPCGTTASLCGVEAALVTEDEELMNESLACMKLVYTLLFTLRGFPEVCGGDERVRLNDYSYHLHPRYFSDPRSLHRGFADKKQEPEPEVPLVCRQAIQHALDRLQGLRRDCPVLGPAGWLCAIDTGNPRVLGILRRTREQQMVIMANLWREPAVAQLKRPGRYTPVGETVALAGTEISLGAYEVCMLWREET